MLSRFTSPVTRCSQGAAVYSAPVSLGLTATQVFALGEALEQVRSEGRTRAIGFTGAGDTDALHQVVDSGRFDVMQCYFNIVNPSGDRQMPGEGAGRAGPVPRREQG